jgi:transposase
MSHLSLTYSCNISFCSEYPELQMTRDQYIENLTAAHVKTFLDWFRETHQESVEAASSLNSYWRILKSLYVDKHGFGMDEAMQRDCRNVCSLRLLS